MHKRISILVFLLFYLPALRAQVVPSDATNGSASNQTQPRTSSSTSPSQSQQTGVDARGVPCGPGGCIVSNDQATQLREAGAEGQSDQTSMKDRRLPNGVAPDYDDQRKDQREENLRSGQPKDPRALPREPLTAFEKYVQDSTGHKLQIYGRALFLNTPADFMPATSLSPPVDYVVGTGDQLKVRGWGNVSIDVLTTVDRNGQVFVPQIGAISVAGMRVGEAKNAIQAAIKKQYSSFDLSVNLGQLRSIQIFVLGEARRPGVYTVSSLSTLINALFTSGGPTASGSLRDIQLKREGKTLTHFDVYDLLLRGDKSKDVALQPGDVILIPPVGAQASVDGEVNRPAIYELRGGSSVEALIDISGGLTPLAARDRATLDRIDEAGKRFVQDFPLTGPQKLIQAQTGDMLRVFPISSRVDRAVTLQGNVGTAGRFPWHEGMRVTDLIPSRMFLLTRNYFNKQNALNPALTDRPFGVAEDNQGKKRGSTSAISNDQATAAASGAPVLDAEQPLELASHDTEISWSYAVIERLAKNTLTTDIIPFILGEAIDQPSSTENQLLEPGDIVVVYSSRDLNLPVELRAEFVRIDGEINHPGIYRIKPEETLRDVVSRAGGVAPHGYLYAAQFVRESVRLAQEAKLQRLLKDETQRALSPVNQSTSSDSARSATDIELRKAYIKALSDIHASGRVVLDIAPDATGTDRVPDIALQDGDHFFVPARPSTVDVVGNVYNQGALRYIADNKVRDYLSSAGGPTREGDKPREFLLRADGLVVSRSQVSRFDALLIHPGDTVVVPARLKPGFNLVDLLAYTQLISSFALTAVAVRALN